MRFRLSVLLLGPGLFVPVLLPFRMVLLLTLPLLLCVARSSDAEKHRQKGGAGDSGCFHSYIPFLPLYCKLPVVAFAGLPMASPETRSSTLRFCCRPEELPFEATGKVLPNPLALTEFMATPCCTR